MIAYRDLVDVALAADPAEKTRMAAEVFLRTTVFVGLAVTYSPRPEDPHRFLFARGYGEKALSHLREDFVIADPMYRRSVADNKVLTWRDTNFAEGPAARTWLTPAGYRNGFSVPIRHPVHGEIGSIHGNSYLPDFGDNQLDAARAFADLLASALRQKIAQDEIRLTARELYVVRLIANDASNPQIAAELCVSRRTVATHIENILRKLDARSRVGIAVEATRRGLIS